MAATLREAAEARKRRRTSRGPEQEPQSAEELLPDDVLRKGELRYANWTDKRKRLLLNFVEPTVFDWHRMKHMSRELLKELIEFGFGLKLFGKKLDTVGNRRFRQLCVSLKR
eukprot:4568302-Pyramimonas_sp.AAC.1